MKLNFNWKDDNEYHQYCAFCHAEKVEPIHKNGKTYYYCSACKQTNERSIVLDPQIKWWLDESGEYWHESVGVFVRNTENKFLFFERNIFPFALTVPSGHVDINEDIDTSALRELNEEVGLTGKEGAFVKIASEDIQGDSCRRGSDGHRWHAYLLSLNDKVDIIVREEGISPVWLALEEALKKKLTFPVKYIIERYKNELK